MGVAANIGTFGGVELNFHESREMLWPFQGEDYRQIDLDRVDLGVSRYIGITNSDGRIGFRNTADDNSPFEILDEAAVRLDGVGVGGVSTEDQKIILEDGSSTPNGNYALMVYNSANSRWEGIELGSGTGFTV